MALQKMAVKNSHSLSEWKETDSSGSKSKPAMPNASATPLRLTDSVYSDKVMGRMWNHLGIIYGHRWATQYGTTPASIWVKGLSDMSADEISTGLNGCATRPDGWPPNLPEFRELCRVSVATLPACHRQAKPYAELPKPESITPRADALRYLAAIRKQITASNPSEAQADAAYENMKRRQNTAFEATDARTWAKPDYTDSRVISFQRMASIRSNAA